jgi:protein gp37
LAENSKIEWCDHTINFWHGCSKVSPACAHCYAEAMDARFHPALPGVTNNTQHPLAAHWGPHAPRLLRVEKAAAEALRFDRQAKEQGTRFRVFCSSMADLFEDRPDLDEARLEALDVMIRTPHLDWLILTKRPEKVLELLARAQKMAQRPDLLVDCNDRLAEWLGWWLSGRAPKNVWLGTTVEDQERADQRIPALLQVPAAVRFLSCEPLLGPVDIRHRMGSLVWTERDRYETTHGIDWVICGGESGPHARPMHPVWARSLRDQCAAAGVPFLFKQWGEWGASHEHMATGEPRFCVLQDFNHWVNKASTWMSKGDLLLDANGVVLHCGYDIRHGKEPFTALRKVGKARAGRLLDGNEHNGFPQLTDIDA